MSTSLSIENSDSLEFRSGETLTMDDILLPYETTESESEVSCSQKNETKKKKKKKKNKKKKPKAMKCNSDPQSGAMLPLDAVCPSGKKPTRAEPKESLEYRFREKLNLGKDSRPLEKTEATKCKKVPEDILSRSRGKLPLGTVSPSQKKSNTTKPKENLENDVFRSGETLSMDDILLPYESESESEVSCSQKNKKKKMPKAMKCNSDPQSGEKVPMESPKLKPDEYLDYFPQHYEISFNGIKVYTEVIHPKKKKKPKAIEKKDNMRFDEKREDLEDILFRESEGMEKTSRIFAGAALSYLREQGHNLELVKPGSYELGEVTRGYTPGYRAHFNFKAKRKDDPSAPVEMYFGQLCYYGETEIVVECCVSMGESDSLPYDPEDRGCQYCTNTVHHPLGGCKGIVWGLLTFSNKTRSFTIA